MTENCARLLRVPRYLGRSCRRTPAITSVLANSCSNAGQYSACMDRGASHSFPPKLLEPPGLVV